MRDLRTDLLILLRCLEEIDHLGQVLFGLVDPGNVGERSASSPCVPLMMWVTMKPCRVISSAMMLRWQFVHKASAHMTAVVRRAASRVSWRFRRGHRR